VLRVWPILGAAIFLGADASGQNPAAPAPDAAAAVRADFRLQGEPKQGALLRGTAPPGTVELALDGKRIATAADGSFIVGFDRDHGSTASLTARLADGATVRRSLPVARRTWRVQHVNIARRPGGPTAEFLRLRERELARIAAARAVDAPSEGWRQPLIWPATGRISGVFGSQRVYRGEPASFHSGVDVAPGAGAPVVAPADGVVVLAGPPAFSLEGNLIVIDHGMGLNSAFLHLASQAVRQGQQVRQGQLVGTVGATGRATGPHLHWSMRWKDARIDPQPLAGPMRR
jgi:murein DD-endopeptidase MepM/ murein hydrolase activator NlpD